MHLSIIILFLVFAIVYLCGLLDGYKKTDLSFDTNVDLSLIEHLTQHKNKTKNYKSPPQKYQSYNRSIQGKKQGDNVHFQYEFPLVDKYHHVFSYTLNPQQTSHEVDLFGIPATITERGEDETVRFKYDLTEQEFADTLKKGGWYYSSGGKSCGVDYPALVRSYRRFAAPIATSIYEALISKGADNYFNRVQAALNFVQYIAYGIPDFDTPEWYYHELAVPPESFILSYADCDSKSLLMASILHELIPLENFVLIACHVKSVNDKIAGPHMMIAVSDLGVEGEIVKHNNRDYILLETTAPWIIGKTDWSEINIEKIYTLA